MQRDFKGVWIPKHIWLHPELSIWDKVVLTEIDSLDQSERGCYASNKYLAEFCGCSESAVSKSISKLTKLGLLYCKNFDGRQRELKSNLNRLVNSNIEPSKIYEAGQENLLQSNIDNKTTNKLDNNISSKELLNNTNNISLEENIPKGQLFSTNGKPKKQGENQYNTVIEKLSSNPKVRTALQKYLAFRRKKGLTIEQWETIVTRFKNDTTAKCKSVDEAVDAIEKCLMDGNMKLFYKEYNNKNYSQLQKAVPVNVNPSQDLVSIIQPSDFLYQQFYFDLPSQPTKLDPDYMPNLYLFADGSVKPEELVDPKYKN